MNGIKIKGSPFDSKTYVGSFTNMRDCANAVHSAENVAWAAVMESPYAEDGNLLDISGTGLEFMCWSIDEVPDYDSPMVEEDSAFMSCYLKG